MVIRRLWTASLLSEKVIVRKFVFESTLAFESSLRGYFAAMTSPFLCSWIFCFSYGVTDVLKVYERHAFHTIIFMVRHHFKQGAVSVIDNNVVQFTCNHIYHR